MAKLVHEIMNRELFTVRPHMALTMVSSHILSLGISGAPVVSPDGVALGMVSLRDLIGDTDGKTVGDVMSYPAIVIDENATLDEAAQILSRARVHRLIVVGDGFRAVGVVSAVDLVRALAGLPIVFPEAFPHFDSHTGMVWSNDHALDLDTILEVAPASAGVLLLIAGGPNIPETIVWAEQSFNLANRLIELVSAPSPKVIERLLENSVMRFRFAQVDDLDRREAALRVVQEEMGQSTPPNAGA